MKNILILFAHPALHKSRLNQKLVEAVRSLEYVTFNDLYESYPDFYIDIRREQYLLKEHDIIVWHHPFYWYSCPALLKEWMDLVLEHNFAYGTKGRALAGKQVMSALSTGGSIEAYTPSGENRYALEQFLLPFRQTAFLCGMHYLPPFVVHAAHDLGLKEIEHYAQKYKEAIEGLHDDKYSLVRLNKVTYFNELV